MIPAHRVPGLDVGTTSHLVGANRGDAPAFLLNSKNRLLRRVQFGGGPG